MHFYLFFEIFDKSAWIYTSLFKISNGKYAFLSGVFIMYDTKYAFLIITILKIYVKNTWETWVFIRHFKKVDKNKCFLYKKC